ncbi:MAG: Hsp70 family protein, partial [Chloroflexi bacterium]|nr:Hsp70 family protein [Chloroflexota bacterium]
REVSALRSAIELQLGYDIFALLDDAKRRLSSVPATLVTYHRAAVDVDARVTRSRFEAILGATLARINRLLDECLAAAGISALEVDEVVTTGGSSAIPAVRALLLRRFPQARSRDADPFSTVAAGLALS